MYFFCSSTAVRLMFDTWPWKRWETAKPRATAAAAPMMTNRTMTEGLRALIVSFAVVQVEGTKISLGSPEGQWSKNPRIQPAERGRYVFSVYRGRCNPRSRVFPCGIHCQGLSHLVGIVPYSFGSKRVRPTSSLGLHSAEVLSFDWSARTIVGEYSNSER